MTEIDRRGLLKLAAVAGTLTVGLAGGQAAVAAVARPVAAAEPAGAAFDEIYRGRQIEGGHLGTGPESAWVRVDGQELHVMRKASGGYISATNHYDPHPTLRDLARAAVDELRGADLVELSHHHR